MSADPHQPAAEERRPKRFHYGLRLLFQLALVVALVLWGYRQWVAPYYAQQEFLAAAKEFGASVTIQSGGKGQARVWDDTLTFGWRDQIVEVRLCLSNWDRFADEPPEFICRFDQGMRDPPMIPDDQARTQINRETKRPQRLQACLSQLRHLAGLKTLGLGFPATDKDLVHLHNLRQLETLDIRCADVTDAGLKHLQGLTGLKHLYLRHLEITDAGLASLRTLRHLETLDLTGNKITDRGLSVLAGMPNLKHLYLNGTEVSNVELNNLPGLEHLDLSHTNLSSLRLWGTPRLRSLNLTETKIDNDDLRELSPLRSLQQIGLSYTLIDGQGLAALRDLPKLEALCVYPHTVADEGLAHLKAMKACGTCRLDMLLRRRLRRQPPRTTPNRSSNACGPNCRRACALMRGFRNRILPPIGEPHDQPRRH